jgi:large conductance mechanosensitive channel
MLKEFRDFILRGNVLDLAVGIIIGAAFTAIVNSLVADIINPIIGLILGQVDFSNLYVALDGKTYPSLKAARDAGAAVLAYGSFITAIINFVIIAFVVFMLVRAMNTMMKRIEKEKAAAPPPAPAADVVLLGEIRDLLKTERN